MSSILHPTDVLEALNRLLDDNRELVIPETQEVVRPHPHFMLFATQNPPGLYAGRKILSRAFRNRFLEVHFEDVPQAELETILCQRCRIAPSYGKKIVSVFRELQKRRQAGRVFETKQGFATLRDLFRWAGRDAIGYQELAENGYMLLAERARRDDDKAAVKEVIESVMGVKIDENALYNLHSAEVDFASYLDCPIPASSSKLIWTSAMKRLFILVSRALRFNEPVLLVGETGSGKTSVCQIFADASSKHLHGVNCHQNTETADLIGGLRPVRNRSTREADVYREGLEVLQQLGLAPESLTLESVGHSIQLALDSAAVDPEYRSRLEDLRLKFARLASIFEWHDGPLVDAMRRGDVFLLDEISLADDSVLERLNSVLEPGRTLVLAERGGDDLEHPAIRADDAFKLVATMNPGGDYGKKELSPALRNRFTEIWVPPVDDRNDLELIVDGMWTSEALRPYTPKVLDFVEWLSAKIGDRSLLSLRDIMAWVAFSNSAHGSGGMSAEEIFHHAAQMTFLDGLGSLPQFSSYSKEAIRKLKDEALSQLQALAPLADAESHMADRDPSEWVQLGTFAIPRGPREALLQSFNLRAPTTQDNAMRVVRACQVSKPILLEGSPGVGKTSLVAALANIAGHHLCRINLSDQTDLIDLFGSDLPVEGGGPGEFAWKDAEFLTALQQGHWVLLDEMNLAPQAVLEGLNAVLDHRGTVYIPELGRSFTRHPSFRIFAAQNPLNQGGGRKGLPKSFLNRFTKVYVEELTASDLQLVCQHLYPTISPEVLQAMISFNTALNEEVSIKRSFARAGSPWEFNLRDVLRWATLVESSPNSPHPSELLRSVYLDRFREVDDRQRAQLLFDRIFQMKSCALDQVPSWAISAGHLQIGGFHASRQNLAVFSRPGRVLKMQLPALETIGHCISQQWLAIVTGPRNSGKTQLVRTLANFCGRALSEVSLNSATDTMDILGSFEQVDDRGRVFVIVDKLFSLLHCRLRSSNGCHLSRSPAYDDLWRARHSPSSDPMSLLRSASSLILEVEDGELQSLYDQIQRLITRRDGPGRFEWVDGPLVRAMKEGSWLLLDGANLCNPSVLDRLNSLCEVGGFLTLSERGYVDGQVQVLRPHPDFRIFMSVDPQYGELSRAMRNRGIEIALSSVPQADDATILQDHSRLPLSLPATTEIKAFDAFRRGISSDDVIQQVEQYSSGRSLDQDSASSSLLDRPALGNEPTAGSYYFLARTIVPPYALHFRRFVIHTGVTLDGARIFSEVVPAPSLRPAIAILRNAYAQAWDVPHEFVSAQPMDFYLKSRGKALDGNLLLRALDLNVAVHLQPESPSRDASTSYGNVRAVKDVHAVLDSIKTLATATLASLDSSAWVSQSPPIELALTTLRFAEHLQKAQGTTHFNFSAVQAISAWLADALEDCPPNFLPLIKHIKSLREAVALSTGLGMNEIWSKFIADKTPDFSPALIRLNELACNLRDAPGVQSLRRHCFDLISVQSLDSSLSDDEMATHVALREDLLQRLTNAAVEEFVETKVDWGSLIPQLAILASSRSVQSSAHDNLTRFIEQLIQVECREPSNSLLRLVAYQHMLWTLKAEKDVFPVVLRLQMQWLSDVWNTTTDEGPALLLRPYQLDSTISSCDLKGGSLGSFEKFERIISRRVRLTQLQCEQDIPRVDQLAEVLHQAVLFVSACFASSFGGSPPTSAELDIGPSLIQTLAFVEGTKSRPLEQAVHKHLHTSLHRFASLEPSQRNPSDLGSCWIALSRVILDLFVPDAPVDPAAIHNCATLFWTHQEALLTDQIRLHSQTEQLITGVPDNIVVEYLQAQLEEARAHLRDLPVHPTRADISRLHMFWSEISQFQSHIISPAKIDALLASLQSPEQGGILRENVLQQSMAGFCQRLDSVYPEFADISSPIQLVILYLRLGLRLIVSSASSDVVSNQVSTLSSSLVAFPSIRGAGDILADSRSGPSVLSPFRHLLLNMAAVAVNTRAGINIKTQITAVHTIYGQAQRLWLIDRAREGEAEAAANSLYRHKPMDYEDMGEAEMEEREFLLLFPSFEDALDPEAQNQPTKGSPSARIQSQEMERFVELHLQVLAARDQSTSLAIFDQLRQTTLEELLRTHFSSLSDVLDGESLPFQLALLHASLSSTQVAARDVNGSYSFYTDPNIPEVKKAVAVLTALKNRLQALIQEWPDQMVLQHLLERCDAALALDLSSPIAKVLSALEQLLLQTDDWENYANRHNTLTEHRSTLTTLIVEWRRLELACWQVLLQSQAKTFSDGVAEWWFHVYDATIRGPLDAAEREKEDPTQNVSDYLTNLIPLLDDFVRTSPLGQFHSRLQLLGSFEVYCAQLAASQSGDILHRVHRILHATLRHYNLFASQVSSKLSEQRNVLEKEVRGFIKLASWKDINVQALNASAQRTHHQLYKIIRKFRDVLRQPVSVLLSPRYAGDAESQRLITSESPTISPSTSFPATDSVVAPSGRSLNLAHTFKKFGDLLNTQIQPFITSRSALIVDNLAVDVIVTAKELAAVAVVSSPAEKRTKQLKALLTRKRKAWSDLLKELKRAGFTVHVKPDVLRQQSDVRWLREQPILQCSTDVSRKAEEYFTRLNDYLPILRSSLSNHHPDLVTRDLQKGVMFVESVFSMAVDSRSRYAFFSLSLSGFFSFS
ncbi:hypothetical protein FB45DRAFT_384103 [Roridomyces roridus]|uniref:AAA+ ATPase domain-containing protein n=1 Tax=Roridomyces roridus TaxID=1738132 RepID=A0AAD7B3H4_9AGAR|nr:hypothetical protein FB45DRAFT_384103 [Roridomyces roridus]